MTVERLKIRCYRCNQLLAVSPNKAGTVVACPKCKADLLIPRLDSQATGDGAEDSGLAASLSQSRKGSASATASASSSASSSGESNSYLDEIAAMIPPELALLRRRICGSRPNSSKT